MQVYQGNFNIPEKNLTLALEGLPWVISVPWRPLNLAQSEWSDQLE